VPLCEEIDININRMFRLGKTGFHFNATHSFANDAGYDRFPHGHDYELTVFVEGRRSSKGMLYDMRELKELVHSEVIKTLDHQNLDNLLTDSSLESLAEWIWQRLRKSLPGQLRVGIQLWETRSIFVEYWGE
jgi:6-pyruvoyl tetrahydropterin synthase/QueD family protein